MQPLVLVACSKQKLTVPSPAKDLYQGALFKKARAVIEREGAAWRILSALHGLVDPDQILAPYECTLETFGRRQRMEWAGQVQHALRAEFNGRQLVALAGEHYRTALAGFDVRIPLFGLGIGEQLQKLSDPTYNLFQGADHGTI